MAKVPPLGMRRTRAKKFPPKIRNDIAEWDIKVGSEIIGAYSKVPLGKRIALEFKVGRQRLELRLSPDDAYELRDDIGHAIDQALGLSHP